MTATSRPANRLLHETSPYLRQHAHNPVDWHPWGPEALEQARRLDWPIFLSIGYSACHWCHVMEHESFENEDIARILNEHFIPIKVDREERPDLDQIYMMAVQRMNQGQGGWPMSVFLTPDLRPFYGGTYYPPDDRYGRPGFGRLLQHLAEAWKNRREQIDEVAEDMTEFVRTAGALATQPGDLDASLITGAVRQLGQVFDSRQGGFGQQPKFPHPMDIRLLLRAWLRSGDEQALHMARFTLERMAMGGIYDHLGGGFARYSTDARWLVPHFEKMLYDNALLLSCYLEAFQATGETFFREVAEETLLWVKREMTSPEGPFYSTLDADSEGVEGKFYVWTEKEIVELLGPEDAERFCSVYGVEPGGNWEHGRNILHRMKSFTESARLLGCSEPDLRQQLDRSRRKLYEVRSRRIWPGRDEKVLTSWNALMIGSLAQASAVLDRPDLAQDATKAADFLLTRMRGADGRLLRTWSQGGQAKYNGYLEDYAFLIDALVSLYEADFQPRWLESALALADVMLEQFWDPAEGGFFFTGKDHEQLIARNKDPHDNAIPSGNSLAVTALLRLHHFTGRGDLLDRAEQTLRLYRGLLAAHPMAAGQMLIALDFYLGPTREVVVVGNCEEAPTREVLRLVRGKFRPRTLVAFQPATNPVNSWALPLLDGKTAQGDVTTYICQNFACQAPAIGVEAARVALAGAGEAEADRKK